MPYWILATELSVDCWGAGGAAVVVTGAVVLVVVPVVLVVVLVVLAVVLVVLVGLFVEVLVEALVASGAVLEGAVVAGWGGEADGGGKSKYEGQLS